MVSPPQSSVLFRLSLGHLLINHLGMSTHVASSIQVCGPWGLNSLVLCEVNDSKCIGQEEGEGHIQV